MARHDGAGLGRPVPAILIAGALAFEILVPEIHSAVALRPVVGRTGAPRQERVSLYGTAMGDLRGGSERG